MVPVDVIRSPGQSDISGCRSRCRGSAVWECALRHTSCLAFNELTQACGLSLALGGKHSGCAGFLPSQPLNTSTCFTFYFPRIRTKVRVCLGFSFSHPLSHILYSHTQRRGPVFGVLSVLETLWEDGLYPYFYKRKNSVRNKAVNQCTPQWENNNISTCYKLFIYQSPGQFLLTVQKTPPMFL